MESNNSDHRKLSHDFYWNPFWMFGVTDMTDVYALILAVSYYFVCYEFSQETLTDKAYDCKRYYISGDTLVAPTRNIVLVIEKGN